jgi:hypothetical protein
MDSFPREEIKINWNEKMEKRKVFFEGDIKMTMGSRLVWN